MLKREDYREECISISSVAIYSLLKKYEVSNTIVDRPRLNLHKKLDEEKLNMYILMKLW